MTTYLFLSQKKVLRRKSKLKSSQTGAVTRTDVEMEITTIDASYTMGGATLGHF